MGTELVLLRFLLVGCFIRTLGNCSGRAAFLWGMLIICIFGPAFTSPEANSDHDYRGRYFDWTPIQRLWTYARLGIHVDLWPVTLSIFISTTVYIYVCFCVGVYAAYLALVYTYFSAHWLYVITPHVVKCFVLLCPLHNRVNVRHIVPEIDCLHLAGWLADISPWMDF